jgi:hypothetical protein
MRRGPALGADQLPPEPTTGACFGGAWTGAGAAVVGAGAVVVGAAALVRATVALLVGPAPVAFLVLRAGRLVVARLVAVRLDGGFMAAVVDGTPATGCVDDEAFEASAAGTRATVR